MADQLKDLVIIGSGPSAMSAAIYTAREDIDTTIFEKSTMGGLVSIIDKIENYPGHPEGIDGFSLASQFEQQAKRFGAHIEYGEVKSIEDHGSYKTVSLLDGGIMKARAILIATGRRYGGLNVKGESEYVGRGVHYCATCDGAFYRGKNIAVVGGANSAIQEAIYLTKFVNHIDLLVRSSIKASKVLEHKLDELVKLGKISIHLGVSVEELVAVNDHIREIIATQNNKRISIDTDGVFIFTGMKPNSELVSGTKITLSSNGSIKTNDRLETNIPGIFASGDIRDGSTKQIASAVGEGATAALSIRDYLQSN